VFLRISSCRARDQEAVFPTHNYGGFPHDRDVPCGRNPVIQEALMKLVLKGTWVDRRDSPNKYERRPVNLRLEFCDGLDDKFGLRMHFFDPSKRPRDKYDEQNPELIISMPPRQLSQFVSQLVAIAWRTLDKHLQKETLRRFILADPAEDDYPSGRVK